MAAHRNGYTEGSQHVREARASRIRAGFTLLFEVRHAPQAIDFFMTTVLRCSSSNDRPGVLKRASWRYTTGDGTNLYVFILSDALGTAQQLDLGFQC